MLDSNLRAPAVAANAVSAWLQAHLGSWMLELIFNINPNPTITLSLIFKQLFRHMTLSSCHAPNVNADAHGHRVHNHYVRYVTV